MTKVLLRTLFFIITCYLFQVTTAFGQAATQNISTLNVGSLSDEQIIQLLNQARNSGLSDDQIVQQAIDRGMVSTEADKLRTRIAGIRKRQGAITATDTAITTRRSLNYTPDTGSVTRPRGIVSLDQELPVFGANLFSNGNVKFEPNLKLATPVNYIVGPDDQLAISVYGHSLANWKLNVSPEGSINIPGAGMLNVAGKTIEQVTQAIKSKLAASHYAIGQGTNVQVSLGNIRSINIIMVGQLVKPGTYTLPSLATAFNALYAAGGPNKQGSLRQIEIIRNNRVVRRLDVYDFLVKGDQKDNIGLQDQDIIRVPTYRIRVELSGQVKVPAKFEVLPGETLQNVITFAGGFTDSAYTARIQVSQISDRQRRITDVTENDYQNYIPLRGDKYIVETVLSRFENRVSVLGAVFRPGIYELDPNLTLLGLISKAAGLKEDAFMERGTITRLKPDNTTEIIAFSPRSIINKSQNITLQREDVVNIASIFDLRDQYQVSINGAVRKPGTYFYADSMRVEDLVFQAGGFSEGASTSRLEVARRLTDADPFTKDTKTAVVFSTTSTHQLTAEEKNFILKPFDIVSVYSLPGYERQRTVKVEGEVLYPGTYVIENRSEKISDLVKRAGGLIPSADVSGSTLKRDNISILGIDQNKTNADEILRDKQGQLDRLKQASQDTTNSGNVFRNNYVGIDLKKILESPGATDDLLLEGNDILRIPKKEQIVRVNGEVLYPSAVVYRGDKSFKSYVSNAGGFSPYALKKSAYIVYPNGTVKATHTFLFFKFHPAVRPGSEIYVPRKPVKRNNTLQEILGLTTGLASIGAIILGIISLQK